MMQPPHRAIAVIISLGAGVLLSAALIKLASEALIVAERRIRCRRNHWRYRYVLASRTQLSTLIWSGCAIKFALGNNPTEIPARDEPHMKDAVAQKH
jgi:hypothetical protein